MTNLQIQARALGDETRHGIFQYVVAADRPVDVAELTAHLGLNHNAIRQHLAKLADAHLVVERTAPPSGPGRPKLVYELDPTADSRWGAPGPYERLALLLTEMVQTGDDAVEVGRRAGRQRADDRAGALGRGDHDADAVDVMVDLMARQGFDPTVRRRGARIDIRLRDCPFETTAVADPDTVCGLHLGIARGMAEALPGLEVDDLVRRDPRRAGCRLVCHTESPDPA